MSGWTFLLLNTYSSVQLNKVEQKQTPQTLSGRSGDAVHIDKAAIKVDVPDIVSVSACADLTLPAGAGLCIDTIHGPVFLVSILVIVHSRIILWTSKFKFYCYYGTSIWLTAARLLTLSMKRDKSIQFWWLRLVHLDLFTFLLYKTPSHNYVPVNAEPPLELLNG